MRLAVLFLTLVFIFTANGDAPHIRLAAETYEKGRAAQSQGQFDLAIKFFMRAIAIEPTYCEPREALIQANLSAGYRIQAAAAITQLLEIEPGDIRDRLTLAQILQEQHQQERAFAQFSAVLNIDRYNADALLGFASAARQLGMQDRAAEALDCGRKHFPQDTRFKAASEKARQ